ncbi:MAG TPA: RimK/LysX family protein, partial [Gammaproteobacteria bacterium]|nr:RimK/LysX family protein [Gammaproteobacteria bacterium]
MIPQKNPIGFEEWIALPELNLPAIKAKTDTGAQTSALHAFMVEKFEDDEGIEKIKFGIHPIPEQPNIAVFCEANLVDERKIISSNGKMELRYIIRTLATFGEHSWPIEISLTNRETMNYRMLIGRSAMEGKLVVVPDASFLLGKLDIEAYKDLKTKPHERK